MSKEGLITPEKLKEIAKNILDFLKREDINSIGNVEGKLEKIFNIGQNHRIQIELRSSKLESKAYTISYIILGGGAPLEIRMNSDLNYSEIIVKRNLKLDDYIPFIFDPLGNIIQSKTINNCSVLEIKKELEKLAS